MMTEVDFKNNIKMLEGIDSQLLQHMCRNTMQALKNTKRMILNDITMDICKSSFIIYIYRNKYNTEYISTIYVGLEQLIYDINLFQLKTFYSNVTEDNVMHKRCCLILKSINGNTKYYIKKYKDSYIFLDATTEKFQKEFEDLCIGGNYNILNYKTKAMDLSNFTDTIDVNDILRIKELDHFTFHTIDKDYEVFIMDSNDTYSIYHNLKQLKKYFKYEYSRILTAIIRYDIGTGCEQFTIKLMDEDSVETEYTLHCFKIYKSFVYFGMEKQYLADSIVEEEKMGKIEIKDHINRKDIPPENTVGNILLMKAGLLYLISKCKDNEKINQVASFVDTLKNDEILTINNWVYRFVSDNIQHRSYKEIEEEIESKIFNTNIEKLPEMSAEFYNLLQNQFFNKNFYAYCVSDEKSGLRKINGDKMHFYEYTNPNAPEQNKRFIMITNDINKTNIVQDTEYFVIISSNYEYDDNYYLLLRPFFRSDLSKGHNVKLFDCLKKAQKVRYSPPVDETLSIEDTRNEVALESLKKVVFKSKK